MDIEPNQPPVQPQWSATPPPPEKKKFPVWGWILIAFGVCCCGCIPILAAVLFPVFAQAKIAAQTTSSMSNLKQINTSWMIYMSDNDDVSMLKENWNEALMPYAKNESVFLDPLLPIDGDQLGYGYNGALSKAKMWLLENPQSQIGFGLTTAPGKDALVTKDTLRTIDKSSDKTIVSYADGHAKKLDVTEAQQESWQPKFSKE